MFFSFVLFVGCISSIVADEVTMPPPIHGNFGGNKRERAEVLEKLLQAATPEQKAIFGDKNPALYEGVKAFKMTMSTQSQTYAILKASISSNKPECDSMAHRRADEIINKARDDTINCLATYRTDLQAEKPGIEDLRDLPSEKIVALVIPLDNCYQSLKTATLESIGYVMLDYSICTSKP